MQSKDNKARMLEFVKYHIEGDGECNNTVLKEWVRRRNLTLQERYELAFLFAVTYCVESAVICFEKQREYGRLTLTQLQDLKPLLVFQSDRKYMRMKDSFERCMEYWYDNNRDAVKFLDSVSTGNVINLDKAIKTVSGWVMFGRFSSFLFLETLVELTSYEIKNTTIDWKHGDTATSGLLDLFGFHESANRFDKTGKLAMNTNNMDKMLAYTLQNIAKAGGITNVTEVETSLCAYRKLYKGSRYNGYYLDRMLEEIYAMEKQFPAVSKELIDIRLATCNRKYLGEVGGWRGIRKDMKKYYLQTGEIN